MNKVVIFADSVCDLNKEIALEHDIKIMPLHVNFGNISLDDSEDLKGWGIYNKEKEYGVLPKTSALNYGDIEKYVRPVLDEGANVLFISMASSMSTTYSSFESWKKEIEGNYPNQKIEVLDSMNLTSGIGLLLLEACKLRDEGYDVDVIKTEVSKLIPRIRTQFVLENLTYLHKGGRCSAVAKFFGGALHLHPLIQVKKGVMGVGKLFIGSLKTAVHNMTNFFLKEESKVVHETLFITYSAGTDNEKNQILEILDKKGILQKFKNVYLNPAGAVVSSHCGPGTIGILYILNEDI